MSSTTSSSQSDTVGSSAPVWVHEDVHVADSTTAPSRVIAIAVDASKFSEHAMNWALQNLIRPDDQIVLLNVRPIAGPNPAVFSLYAEMSGAFEQIEEMNKKESHDLLRAYAAKLIGKYNVRAIALRGDPRDEIAIKCDDLKADILVLGSRGLSALKRAVLGSVSEYLLHHMHIPVIIPKMTDEEKVKAA